MKKISLLLIILCLSILGSSQNEEPSKKERKNTIRWNPTTMIFNSSNITLGYERILKKNQSLSVNTGLFMLPELISEDNQYLSLEKKGGKLGYTITADYRFYLKKYNADPHPLGFIWGLFLHIITIDLIKQSSSIMMVIL